MRFKKILIPVTIGLLTVILAACNPFEKILNFNQAYNGLIGTWNMEELSKLTVNPGSSQGFLGGKILVTSEDVTSDLDLDINTKSNGVSSLTGSKSEGSLSLSGSASMTASGSEKVNGNGKLALDFKYTDATIYAKINSLLLQSADPKTSQGLAFINGMAATYTGKWLKFPVPLTQSGGLKVAVNTPSTTDAIEIMKDMRANLSKYPLLKLTGTKIDGKEARYDVVLDKENYVNFMDSMNRNEKLANISGTKDESAETKAKRLEDLKKDMQEYMKNIEMSAVLIAYGEDHIRLENIRLIEKDPITSKEEILTGYYDRNDGRTSAELSMQGSQSGSITINASKVGATLTSTITADGKTTTINAELGYELSLKGIVYALTATVKGQSDGKPVTLDVNLKGDTKKIDAVTVEAPKDAMDVMEAFAGLLGGGTMAE